jgi:SMODS-associating 4TM effector domain
MIGIAQNTEKQIHRLAAQRQLYATAKRVFGWQLFIGGPIAATGAVLVFFIPELKVYVASWGLLVVLFDLIWLTPWQKNLRNSAARIQEEFDCEVLQLPWNDLKAGKHPDPELVKTQSTRYEKWATKMPPLRNWYSSRVDELPLHIGRIVCQRSNCWWDSTQRRHYAAWLVGIVGVVFVVVCGLALSGGASLEAALLKGVIPLSPALLIALRQFSEQREAADRLDKLKDHCATIWKSALSGKSKSSLIDLSRNLQDEILENRRKAPPVLDFIFKSLRNEYEASMNHAADHYVSEAKTALKIT